MFQQPADEGQPAPPVPPDPPINQGALIDPSATGATQTFVDWRYQDDTFSPLGRQDTATVHYPFSKQSRAFCSTNGVGCLHDSDPMFLRTMRLTYRAPYPHGFAIRPADGV